jgi:predicted cupin superfamily sugar epimerase
VTTEPAALREILNLQPHPTCGFVAETYRSDWRVRADALPERFGGDRPLGSVLYFLVTPDANINLHRIKNDQMYHHYLGDPLEVLMLFEDGRHGTAWVGTDFAAGQRPQLFLPGKTFHVSRLPPGASHALLGTTEWPGVEPADVEIGDPAALAARFPAAVDLIQAFVHGG